MTIPTGLSETAPDPERVGAEILSETAPPIEAAPEEAPKRRGRPPGSGKKKTTPKAKTPIPEEAEPTDQDIQQAGFLGATVWRLIGPLAKVSPLDPEEELLFGKALAPVLAKYLPKLGGYEAELTLVLVIAGLYQRKRIVEDKGEDNSILLPEEFGKMPDSVVIG